MSTDDANFMAMLHEGGVTASSRWADVQRRHAGDPRFVAVVGEQRLLLFRDFVRMRQEVDDMQLSDAEKDYMARRLCVAVPVCWWCCGSATLGVPIETGIIELPSIPAGITMTIIIYEQCVRNEENIMQSGAERSAVGCRAVFARLIREIDWKLCSVACCAISSHCVADIVAGCE